MGTKAAGVQGFFPCIPSGSYPVQLRWEAGLVDEALVRSLLEAIHEEHDGEPPSGLEVEFVALVGGAVLVAQVWSSLETYLKAQPAIRRVLDRLKVPPPTSIRMGDTD